MKLRSLIIGENRKSAWQQFWWKYKFGTKRFINKILDSNLLGNTLLSGLYGLAFTAMLMLWFPLSWKLFASGVGIYFIIQELYAHADKWWTKKT